MVKRKRPKVLSDIDRQVLNTKSIALDLSQPALPPGKRMSAKGNIYWETRQNRSDRKGRRI